MQDGKDTGGRKKIVYLITKGVWGGAQKYVYSLATSLPVDKFDVSVICGEGEILPDKLLEKGIKIYRINALKRDVSIWKEFKTFFTLFKLIWQIKPDVLHLNSSKAGGIGSLIGRVLFVPNIIFTAHGFAWNEDRKLSQKILISIFSYLTIVFCHKTIVINSREEKQAKELPFIKDSKIFLIRNGIEDIPFIAKNEAREYIEKIIGIDLKKITLIGTIAELHKNKGLSHAIQGLSKVMKPFVYVIVGGGEEKESLQKLIEKYNLTERVFLIGFIENANKYLKAFDIFLLPSIKEGLPYTILEAGQAKIPVIATSVGGIPDIIDTGKNGILVTREKSGEITRAVEYILDNAKEARIFADKLNKKINKEFEINEMVNKTISIY